MDGGAHQQSQGHQAKGDGGNERRRDIAIPRRFCGRLDERVLAACPHEARRTLAHGAGEVGVTRATIVAGELVAGAGAHGAVLTGEAECARAGEVVDAVDAGAGVAAGVASTVINVGLAARASEAWPTAAHDTLTEVQTLSSCREKKTERFELITQLENRYLTPKRTRMPGCAERYKDTG